MSPVGESARRAADAERGAARPPPGRFPDLHRAVSMAVAWHTGQDRKYSGVPYIVHPLRVMSIVREVSDDESMLIAAVLHDVVEDTEATIETVETLFGGRVAALVGWLTDVSVPGDGNREARKAIDREHSASAPSDAQTIKLADLIDNTASITARDPDFAHVYMHEKALLLDVLVRGDRTLHARATALLVDYQHERVQEALRRG